MWERILEAISARLPGKRIDAAGRDYLERYAIFRHPKFSVYLHRFSASDLYRNLHDHPWNWAASLVLSGFYVEKRLATDVAQTRFVNFFNVIRGDTFHRIVLPFNKKPVWTLFIHGPRTKQWGFLRDGKYVVYEDDPEGRDSYSPGWLIKQARKLKDDTGSDTSNPA